MRARCSTYGSLRDGIGIVAGPASFRQFLQVYDAGPLDQGNQGPRGMNGLPGRNGNGNGNDQGNSGPGNQEQNQQH